MKKSTLKFLLMACFMLIVVFGYQKETLGATSPYDVDSSVRTGWSDTYGNKSFFMSSGRNFVYDIYSQKYNSNGYSIVTKDFGKGSQQYVRFQGWAILFGHYRHTSTNHETYIVAKDELGNEKVYGTLPYGNLSATEDVEFGKSNSTPTTVYAECPATATNQTNVVTDGGCNMRYDNVGFDAYLPLQELFPNASTAKKWTLYLVKRVNNHIVYTNLNIPFEFDKIPYLGGQVSLTSGVNASVLQMNSYPVIRRTSADGGGTGATLGYFTQGKNYTRVAQDESGTAVWFGVRSSEDNNATRWASSPYWTFGGEQARLEFIPDGSAPVHIEDTMVGAYQDGKVTWVQPNQQATITLRQRDTDSGNNRQYLGLDDGVTNVRSSHGFTASSTTDLQTHVTASHITIDSAKRLENTTYGKVEWKVTPKVSGKLYNLLYYYSDLANNTIGYIDTGRDLRVDGVAPTHTSETISGVPYVDGSTYWMKPNGSMKITLAQNDGLSGNKHQYFRLLDNTGAIALRSRHDFANTDATSRLDQIVSPDVEITSSNRTTNTTTGTVEWTVSPKKAGETYSLERNYYDNVSNITGYINFGTVRVDGTAPKLVSTKLTGATLVSGSNYTVNAGVPLKVTIRQQDTESGNKYQHFRVLDENGTIVTRNVHYFSQGTTSNEAQVTSSKLTVTGALRTEDTTYGTVDWSFVPNTEGTYRLQWYFTDNVGNTLGYQDIATVTVDASAPTKVETTISGAKYVNGTNYWITSGDALDVLIRQNDAVSGNKEQRFSLLEGTNEAVSRYIFGTDSLIALKTTPKAVINSAVKVTNTSYGANDNAVRWTITANTHGSKFATRYYFVDNVGNIQPYTQFATVSVDDEAPEHVSTKITAPVLNGSTYWVKPNSSLTIDIAQKDLHSGNKMGYLRLYNSTTDVRSYHMFSRATDFIDPIFTSNNVSIDSAVRSNITQNGSAISQGTIRWTVTPKLASEKYQVMYYLRDNVDNVVGYVDTGMLIGADSKSPTAVFKNVSTTDSKIDLQVVLADTESGYQSSRYGWSNSPITEPTTWSAWTTANSYTVSQSQVGKWYLHVQAKDKLGNTTGDLYNPDKLVSEGYSNDIPIGFNHIQIYTGKASAGLPVKIKGFTERAVDSTYSNRALTVAIYEQGTNKKVVSKNITLSQLANGSEIGMTIPSSMLTKNTKKTYIAKFENLGTDGLLSLVSGKDTISTDGYTANETTLKRNLMTQTGNLVYEGVIMTERPVGGTMAVHKEKLTVETKKLPSVKTGYGVEVSQKVIYENPLKTVTPTIKSRFVTDNKLIDSYTTYPTEDRDGWFSLFKTKSALINLVGTTSTNATTGTVTTQFVLPKVYVESETGYLFSEAQKVANDSRIKNTLKNGGNKLYIPIWLDSLKEYDVVYESTAPIGVNAVSFVIEDTLDVYAYMYAEIDKDSSDAEILLVPVDKDEPFKGSLPDGWTQEDVDWLME